MGYVRSGCFNKLVCLVFSNRLGALGYFTNLFLGDGG